MDKTITKLESKWEPKQLLHPFQRFFACFLILTFVTVSARAYSQENISLNVKNTPIKAVLNEIESQTDYIFIFSASLGSAVEKKIDFSISSKSIIETMDLLSKLTGFKYQLLDKQIALFMPKETPPAILQTHIDPKAKVAPVPAPEPDRTIKGVILGSNGEPLPGATIAGKGTGISTQSGKDGRFSIVLPTGCTALIVTHVGFKTQEVSLVNGQTEYTIKLQEEVKEIETVVVNGLYERKATSSTGATRSMSNDQLRQVSVTNVFQAISALDPAFVISPSNLKGGDINQLPEMQIRGASSLPNLNGELAASPNLPLFVLDGFEVSLTRVKDLDMNRIRSITLLKDASATAIYGSRAGNGVLVINTYPPRAGRIQATITNDFQISTPDLSSYKVLNSFEKLDFEKRAGLYNTGSPVSGYEYDSIYNERLKNATRGVNTDWMRIPTQTGISNRTSVYLQGGDQYARYGINMFGDLQSGVMKKQDRKNLGAGFDLAYSLNKLLFNNSLSVFQNTANNSPFGSFSTYVKMNPYWAPYDQNGQLNYLLENTTKFGPIGNPIYNATLNSISKSQYFGVRNNFSVRYSFRPLIFIDTKISVEKQVGSGEEFYSGLDTRFAAVTDPNLRGYYSIANNKSLMLQSNTIFNYAFTKGLHDIATSVGAEVSSYAYNNYSITATGFPYDQLDNITYAVQYRPNSRPSGSESTIRRIGAYGNLNYSYNNRYLADFSLRREGSSQFGIDKRFNTFWSAGAGWNIHNEKFLKGNKTVGRLKLRASIGTTATLGEAAYNSQARYNFGENFIYNGYAGVSLVNLANPQLGWQVIRQRNVGMDITLFRGRVELRTDFYSNITQNAITSIPIALSTGFTSYIGNLGKVENKGIEIAARYRIFNNPRKGVMWSVFVNNVSNKNVLVKLSDNIKYINKLLQNNNSSNIAPNTLLQEGQSTNTIFVVKSLGIDPISGREVYLKKDGSQTYLWDVADKIPYGDTEPKASGTFGTNFSHRGLEATLIFAYSFGGKMYNQTLIDRVENADIRYNVDRRAYELGWKQPGDVSLFSAISSVPNGTRLTSRFVQENNYLNFTSLSVGYNFYKHKFVKKVGLNSLQITALTNDIFRVSSVRFERGIQNPFARAYSFSLRATF